MKQATRLGVGSGPVTVVPRWLALALGLVVAACGNDDKARDGGTDPGADLAGGGGDLAGADLAGGEAPQPLGEGLVTLAGGGEQGDADGPRGVARFNNPVNVVVAPWGDLYVADFDNSLVRVVSPEGETRTVTVPPKFFRPFGLAVAPDGTLFVQTDGDTQGGRTGALWRVERNGNVSLVADQVGRVRGLAVLPDGRLAMAEYQKHVILVLTPSSGVVTPLAGMAGQAGRVDGVGMAARFDVPYDLIVLGDGSLLVSDHENCLLRRVGLEGAVSTWAGTGEPGRADGDRGSAQFDKPQGLAIAPDGTVYVSDTGGFTIRRIDPGGAVTTVAGDGTAGFKDADDPRQGKLFGLEGIDVDPDGGYLYIADGNRGEDGPYHRIRRLTLR